MRFVLGGLIAAALLGSACEAVPGSPLSPSSVVGVPVVPVGPDGRVTIVDPAPRDIELR